MSFHIMFTMLCLMNLVIRIMPKEDFGIVCFQRKIIRHRSKFI